MSCSGLFVACAVTVAGAARLSTELDSSVLDSIGRHGENPEEFWSSFNSSLMLTDQSWFSRRRRSADNGGAQDANAPIGGTNPAWARFRPTILAIDGSDNLGRVSSVYTFGAPSSAKVPITDDYHGDGCFDGYRIFSGEVNGNRDPVSWLASAGGFLHSRMKAMTLFSGGDPPWILPCSDATTRFPPSATAVQIALHFTEGYLQTVREERAHIPEHVETFAALMRTCYVDHAEAAELGRGVGYRFVAEAAHGDDLTRLFQNSDMDCIISFRGSDNAGDWINNAAAGSRKFCNFEDVHSGFTEKFTNTVTASQFQTNIRANLPKCASLKVTGHSLGGAVAEMFSGCVNRGSQGLTPLHDLPRGNGLAVGHSDWMQYMSYKGQIAWNRGRPERMPPFA